MSKKKMHFDGAALRGLIIMIAGLVFAFIIGRPLLVMQRETVNISEVGKNDLNWFSHVEADIKYSLGDAVLVTKEENGRELESYVLCIITTPNEDGTIDPDKTFVYLSDDDIYSLSAIAEETKVYSDFTMWRNREKAHQNYHVKGTLSFISLDEKPELIQYLCDTYNLDENTAKELIGTYKLVSEKDNDLMVGVYFGLAIVLIGFILMIVGLIRSRKE